jgi:hypothetical protein
VVLVMLVWEIYLLRGKLSNHFADATDRRGVRPDYSGGFRKFISTQLPVTPEGYSPLLSLGPAANPAGFHIAPNGDRLVYELMGDLLDQTSIQ